LSSFWDRFLITITGGDDVRFISKFEMGETTKGLITNGFFKQGEEHVHRIAIFGPRGNITGMITQSDIMRWVYHHLSEFEMFNKITLQQLGMDRCNVTCVGDQTKAIDAFKKMSKQHLTGIGVVNAEGKLIANVSASDLRGLSVSELPLLEMPVIDFLKLHQAHLTNRFKPLKAISLHAHNTLTDLIKTFVESSIHRVYVIDENEKPNAIITLTDVIKLFY